MFDLELISASRASSAQVTALTTTSEHISDIRHLTPLRRFAGMSNQLDCMGDQIHHYRLSLCVHSYGT